VSGSGRRGLLCVFKPGRHGSDAPPLHPASARRELPLQTQHRVCRCPASLPRLIAFPNPAATDARTLVKRRPDAVHCRDEPAATGLCQQVPNALLIIASSQARALHRSRHQVHAEPSAGARWPERSARRSDSHSRLGTWSRKLRSNRPGVAQELRTTTDCHLAWPVGTLGTTPIRHCPSVALSVPDHFF
jgi:hypothetical protein